MEINLRSKVSASLLAILVAFSILGFSVCAATAAPTPTNLGITAPSSVLVGKEFTVTGNLTNATTDTGIDNASVTLQKFIGAWTDVTDATTDANGSCSFHQTEFATGTYFYQLVYAGNATYAGSTSDVKAVLVSTIPTTLNIIAPPSAKSGTAFPITGNLTITTNGTGIPNAPVTLQKFINGTYTSVNTTSTDANGSCIFSRTESTGTYFYQLVYDGNVTYAGSTSDPATVSVSIPTAILHVTTVSRVPGHPQYLQWIVTNTGAANAAVAPSVHLYGVGPAYTPYGVKQFRWWYDGALHDTVAYKGLNWGGVTSGGTTTFYTEGIITPEMAWAVSNAQMFDYGNNTFSQVTPVNQAFPI